MSGDTSRRSRRARLVLFLAGAIAWTVVSAYPNLPVLFCVDRGGLVGEDGPTHHGQFDLSFLRSLPNMTLMVPKDEAELRHMLYTALTHSGPVAIRYPRGCGVGAPLNGEYRALPIGQAEVLREGQELLIISVGSMVMPALETASQLEKEGFSIGVVNSRFVKPLDPTLVETAQRIGKVLVLEENSRSGGLGGAILELFSYRNAHDVRLKRLGLPDRFIEHGPATVLKQKYGLDVASIVKEARDFCQES